MILIAGAGGMAEAARAMRKIQRDLNRHAQRRRDRRAYRKAKRALADARDGISLEPVTTDFPCKFLCMNCDYLLDPSAYDADDEPTCPGCGDSDWLDLRYEGMASTIRDIELDERMSIPTRYRWLSLLTVALPGSLTLAAVALLALSSAGVVGGNLGVAFVVLTILFGFFAVPTSWFLAARPLSVVMTGDRLDKPMRWRLPTNSALATRNKMGRDLGNFEAASNDELLETPFGRTRCLAYEVRVIFDTPGDSRPPQWVLREQRSTAIQLGDKTIAPEHVHLELDVEPAAINDFLNAADPSDDEAAKIDQAKRFLRERGLFYSDGEFFVYEAALLPGDTVEAAAYGELIELRRQSE